MLGESQGKGAFAATHWSLVLKAGAGDRDALEDLCRLYWQPVYVFTRRRGAAPHDAEDLTQGFFAQLLENDALRSVEPAKGRFRTLLLTMLVNYLNNDWQKRAALKRGGGSRFVSLTDTSVEDVYLTHQDQSLSPEALFDRQWAVALVERAMAQLKDEYVSAGKGRLYAACEPHISRELTAGAASELASRLNTSEGAVKIAVHRLRRRFGELLREAILQIVSSPEEVDEELRHLFAAIAA